MSCTCIAQRPSLRIEPAKKGGDKRCEVNVVNIKTIDPLQNLHRRISARRQRVKDRLQAAHEHSRRDAMSAHIREHETVCAIFELQKVEVIAGDDLSETAEGCDIKPGNRRDLLRQQRTLDNL